MIKNTNRKDNNPIGIFDSGIGGLTVANAIIRHLPNEQIIYFGDTAHLPYGDKSADAIRYFSLKIVKFLLEQNCKMVVIACNSASAAAYKTLLDFFDGNAIFINVIDPLIDEVAKNQFNKVGVIATKATISSGIYERKLLMNQADLEVTSLSTPLLAPMIEEGFYHNNISEVVIENYLSNKKLKGIEALLLACTHYPLIRTQIEAYFENKISVFDSTDVMATIVKKRLADANLLNQKKNDLHQFYVSDFTQSFEETTQIFYKEKIQLKHCPIW